MYEQIVITVKSWANTPKLTVDIKKFSLIWRKFTLNFNSPWGEFTRVLRYVFIPLRSISRCTIIHCGNSFLTKMCHHFVWEHSLYERQSKVVWLNLLWIVHFIFWSVMYRVNVTMWAIFNINHHYTGWKGARQVTCNKFWTSLMGTEESTFSPT